MYTFEYLKNNKDIWKELDIISVTCSWCNQNFHIKNGTLYNIIRRNADGLFCSRKCSGSNRAYNTQNKYNKDGGKVCKRCGEFKKLENFSKLPSPPYFRSECRKCHNYKPARNYSIYKEKASRDKTAFNLSLDDFEVFCNKECYYCNSEVKNVRIYYIDKITGYQKQNILSCCPNCQKLRGSFNHDEFISLCKKITNNLEKK